MKISFINNPKVLLILISFLTSGTVYSQITEEWIHRYTGPESSTDAPAEMFMDSNGDFYTTGKSILSGGYSDIITVKFSSDGVRQWISRYSGAGGNNDDGTCVVTDASGNVYTGGNSSSGGQYDIVVIKYNSTGEQQWAQVYNGPGNFDDHSAGIAADQNGNVFVGGYSYGTGTAYDFVLIKYSPSGNLEWSKRWNNNSNSDDYLKKIAVNSNNEIIISGSSYDAASSFDFVTICYNTLGGIQWLQKYNSTFSSADEVVNIKVDNVNNVYVCGKSVGTGAGYDYALVKYNSSGAQQWTARYNGVSSSDDVATSLDLDGAGNVFVTGFSYNNSSFYDFATVKYNSSGAQQWLKIYNGPQNYFDKALDIKADANGNSYVTGQNIRPGDGTSDVILIKYDPSGSVIWQKSYNGPGDLDDIPVKMKSAGDNIFILASSYSYFFNPLCGTSDYLIINYSLNGNLIWETRYDGAGNGTDESMSMILDNNGNCFVTGTSFDKVTGNDFATLKYNSTGAPLWVSRYDAATGIDKARALALDNAGNPIVSGSGQVPGAGYDIITVKYSTDAGQDWISKYNGPAGADDHAVNVTSDLSGNVYVSGYSDGSGSAKDFVTIKYNGLGSQQWASRYNGPANSNDLLTAMTSDASGNIYVTGNSAGLGTHDDIATVKYNSSGSQVWASRYNGNSNDTDQANSITIDLSGNVYVTGKTKSSGTNFDFITIKFNSSGIRQWAVPFNGTANSADEAVSVRVDKSANVYVTGSSNNSGTGSDYTTIKYNSAGSLQWSSNHNGTLNNTDKASALEIDPAGNLYVTGSCMDIGSGMNYCTIKYNNNGHLKWIKRYDHTDNDSDKAGSLKVDTDGNVYVSGSSKGLEGGIDYATIKYRQDKTLEVTAVIEGLYDEISNKMVTDTAKIILRNAASPYSAVDSSSAVLDTNGSGSFYFTNSENKVPYYLVVSHRNSIETWSAASEQIHNSYLSYDFSSSASQAYGNNLKQKGNKFCMFSGDVNKDGMVELSDLVRVHNELTVFSSGFSAADLNGDKFVDLTDLVLCYNNSYNFVSVIRP